MEKDISYMSRKLINIHGVPNASIIKLKAAQVYSRQYVYILNLIYMNVWL